MRFDWAMFAGGSLTQSAAISSSFLRLSLFPWTVRPGQAGWTASSSPRTRAGNVKPLGLSKNPRIEKCSKKSPTLGSRIAEIWLKCYAEHQKPVTFQRFSPTFQK